MHHGNGATCARPAQRRDRRTGVARHHKGGDGARSRRRSGRAADRALVAGARPDDRAGCRRRDDRHRHALGGGTLVGRGWPRLGIVSVVRRSRRQHRPALAQGRAGDAVPRSVGCRRNRSQTSPRAGRQWPCARPDGQAADRQQRRSLDRPGRPRHAPPHGADRPVSRPALQQPQRPPRRARWRDLFHRSALWPGRWRSLAGQGDGGQRRLSLDPRRRRRTARRRPDAPQRHRAVTRRTPALRVGVGRNRAADHGL